MKINSFMETMRTLLVIIGVSFALYFAFKLDYNGLQIINPEWAPTFMIAALIDALLFGIIFIGLLGYSEHVKASA